MKRTYDEIVSILDFKGDTLGMNSNSITYKSENDPGPSVPGYETRGVREIVDIPSDYMNRSGASNAKEFLDWLRKQ